tara:strand:- start:1756 stop:2121 length:366 start_codon:yes stop_codon:yes gene_type:complete
MPTILNKDVTRESNTLRSDRNINITLTPDQKILMKLKGMKSGDVSIGIGELYDQLTGGAEVKPKKSVSYQNKETGRYEQPSIKVTKVVLNDLRSQNAISCLDINTITKFDQIIKALLDSYK